MNKCIFTYFFKKKLMEDKLETKEIGSLQGGDRKGVGEKGMRTRVLILLFILFLLLNHANIFIYSKFLNQPLLGETKTVYKQKEVKIIA